MFYWNIKIAGNTSRMMHCNASPMSAKTREAWKVSVTGYTVKSLQGKEGRNNQLQESWSTT